jgi:hypothetical protein
MRITTYWPFLSALQLYLFSKTIPIWFLYANQFLDLLVQPAGQSIYSKAKPGPSAPSYRAPFITTNSTVALTWSLTLQSSRNVSSLRYTRALSENHFLQAAYQFSPFQRSSEAPFFSTGPIKRALLSRQYILILEFPPIYFYVQGRLQQFNSRTYSTALWTYSANMR